MWGGWLSGRLGWAEYEADHVANCGDQPTG